MKREISATMPVFTFFLIRETHSLKIELLEIILAAQPFLKRVKIAAVIE